MLSKYFTDNISICVAVHLYYCYSIVMEKDFRRTQRTLSLIRYHFVFCTRYRRKVLEGAVETRFVDILQDICNRLNIKIVAIEVMDDHVHLVLNCLPDISPAEIMSKIKGVTSKKLREEFRHLNHQVSFWTRNYFVSTTENVSSEIIKCYVEQQKKRG